MPAPADSPQRAFPRLISNSVPELQKAINQAFEYIYQLQSKIAAPNLFTAVADKDLTLTIDPQPIPGTMLHLEAGDYRVIGIFEAFIDVNANAMNGRLAIDGHLVANPIARMLITGAGVSTLDLCVAQIWEYSSPSPGVINLWADKGTNVGTGMMHKDNTKILALKVVIG